MHNAVLYCTVLYCTVLYCTVLYGFVWLVGHLHHLSITIIINLHHPSLSIYHERA
jgi:hypothetical protein